MNQVPSYGKYVFAEKKTDYCVCVFVINEGDRLLHQLTKMQKICKDSVDIIIADGGSDDGSTAPARLEKYGVRTLLVKKGAGKLGSQMRMAFDYALQEGYKGVITVDGNGKDGVEAIPDFVAELEKGVDHVQGSRFIPGGYHRNTPLSRLLGVKLLHAPLMRLASGFHYTDTTNGFRAYSAGLLASEELDIFRDCFSGYELHYYMAAEAPRCGFRCSEIPVSRVYPEGKVPTKITSFKGNMNIIGRLFLAVLHYYNPPKQYNWKKFFKRTLFFYGILSLVLGLSLLVAGVCFFYIADCCLIYSVIRNKAEVINVSYKSYESGFCNKKVKPLVWGQYSFCMLSAKNDIIPDSLVFTTEIVPGAVPVLLSGNVIFAKSFTTLISIPASSWHTEAQFDITEEPLINITDSRWKKGIYKKMPGFFVYKNPQNERIFAVGNKVTFNDGTTCEIKSTAKNPRYIEVFLEYPHPIDPDKNGAPAKVTLKYMTRNKIFTISPVIKSAASNIWIGAGMTYLFFTGCFLGILILCHFFRISFINLLLRKGNPVNENTLDHEEFLSCKRLAVYIVSAVCLAAVVVVISYPGIIYSDSIGRFGSALTMGNDNVLYTNQPFLPIFFAYISLALTDGIALFSFVQAFFLFLGILLFFDCFCGKRGVFYSLCIFLCPLFYGISVWHETNVMFFIASLYVILLLFDKRLIPSGAFRLKNIIIYNVSLFCALTVMFNSRTNSITVLPILFIITFVNLWHYRCKMIFGLQQFIIISSLLFSFGLNAKFIISNRSHASIGFVWKACTILHNADRNREINTYLDAYLGEGKTIQAIKNNSKYSIYGIYGLGLSELALPVTLTDSFYKDFIYMHFLLPGETINAYRQFFINAYVMEKQNFNHHVLAEYDYDRWNAGEKWGIKYKDFSRRNLFWQSVQDFYKASFFTQNSWIVAVGVFGFILVLGGLFLIYNQKLNKIVTLALIYFFASSYHWGFLINAQSFEYRYSIPMFSLLTLLFIVCIDVFATFILKNKSKYVALISFFSVLLAALYGFYILKTHEYNSVLKQANINNFNFNAEPVKTLIYRNSLYIIVPCQKTVSGFARISLVRDCIEFLTFDRTVYFDKNKIFSPCNAKYKIFKEPLASNGIKSYTVYLPEQKYKKTHILNIISMYKIAYHWNGLTNFNRRDGISLLRNQIFMPGAGQNRFAFAGSFLLLPSGKKVLITSSYPERAGTVINLATPVPQREEFHSNMIIKFEPPSEGCGFRKK